MQHSQYACLVVRFPTLAGLFPEHAPYTLRIGQEQSKFLTLVLFSNTRISIVHFSLVDVGRFPIEIAKKLAFCVVYFEQAIDDLMPAMTHEADTKRPNGWKNFYRFARRNKVRPGYNGREPLECLKEC